MKVKVIHVFRDKFTGQVYNTGEVLELEDSARVKDLADRRLVEVIEEKKEVKTLTLFDAQFEKKEVVEALKSIGFQATGNMREDTLLSKVTELDEEKTTALKEALGIE